LLKDDACDCVMFSVAQRNKGRSDTALRREFLCRTRKDEKWLAACFFSNVDIAPAHCFADAGAECFGDGFLRGKTRGQMARGKFHRHRILDFSLSKNAIKKSIAKPIDGMLNARAFNKIDTDAEYAHPE